VLKLLHLESQNIQNQKINELEKVEELKNIFPEIFEDGKLNIEKFKNILFDIKDEKTEYYSFNWNGKQDCYKIIKQKSNHTLKVDDDKTIPDGNNVFIEGDNLEVLKLLQTSYHKKIKMIYIDPPYNKDKDFVYSDTWGDTITNYLIQTDQLREEGYTSTKTSSTGRRHTNWLNMIYPRLWLSRNLLKDDGVIFVSIDDDEVHNLRKVMDEIYGEENFVGQFIWKKRTGSNDSKNLVSIDHEYLICYAKNEETQLLGMQKEFENYKNPDNDPLGDWMADNLTCERPNLYYSITDPVTNITYECNKNRVWAYEKNRMQKNIDENKIIFPKDGKGTPMYKRHRSEVKSDKKPISSMLGEFLNATSTKALREILDGQFFDYPKSVELVKILIKQSSSENDIILDFFAGSGTTAHAVMELNQDDEKDGKIGNRKYILIQLPEATDTNSEAYKSGYKKISEITKARIKKAIEKLDYKDGFKSYKLDNSNFQVFKELKKRPNDSFEDIVKMLKMSVFNKNIFAQNAKEIDIVYEVGLKNGFSLSAKYDDTIKLGNYKSIKLFEENREFYFSFADKIELDIAEFISNGSKFICYDKALDDSTKMNLREKIDLETL
jgi:adenine-specific DNA-methyltransferase